jgi:hypothetical protein
MLNVLRSEHFLAATHYIQLLRYKRFETVSTPKRFVPYASYNLNASEATMKGVSPSARV